MIRTAIHAFQAYLFALLAASLAHAQPDETAATAARLMARSGLAVQLRGLAAQIERDFKQNTGQLDERMIAALSAAAKEAFRPEVLQEDIAARLAKSVALADMKAALTWLETEAGQRVTRVEERAGAESDLKGLREYADRLKAKPLDAKRQRLFSELIAATDVVRLAAETQETLALAAALGMDSLQPTERRVGEAVLRARLREILPPRKVREALAQDMPLIVAYAYREVSDADLSGYVGFLKSGAGKRYQDGTSAAYIEGLLRASRRLGELVARRASEANLRWLPEGKRLPAAFFDPAEQRFGRALPARIEHHRVSKPVERTEIRTEQARG